jgi:hypothetical protein
MIKKEKWPHFEKSGAKTSLRLGRTGGRATGISFA